LAGIVKCAPDQMGQADG